MFFPLARDETTNHLSLILCSAQNLSSFLLFIGISLFLYPLAKVMQASFLFVDFRGRRT